MSVTTIEFHESTHRQTARKRKTDIQTFYFFYKQILCRDIMAISEDDTTPSVTVLPQPTHTLLEEIFKGIALHVLGMAQYLAI